MGARGIGAKTRADREAQAKTLRKRLPWERKGLTRLERVVAFLEDLPITQGTLAGQKLRVRDWQRDFLAAVYAEDATGQRPVRTAILSLPRKCGKTQIVAGLALCHLVGPEAEPRGEVYAAANDRFQAGKVFNELCAIIGKHPEIDARVNIIKFRKEIEVLEGAGEGSIYSTLSADATTKMGLSPSFVVYDEAGTAPKRDLFDALDTAMGARTDPLMCIISTQAADDHHFLSELIDYGLKVKAGEVADPSFHLTLFATDNEDDPWSPETWARAIPALGDFRSLEDVARQAAQAQRVPSKESAFRNLLLNMRVAAHVRFLSAAEWAENGATPDLDQLEGRACFAGRDLSASRDLTAFVLVFPDDVGGFDVVPRFFLPEGGIRDKSDADRVPYDVWALQGLLTLIPGATVDPGFVAEAMGEAAATYDLRAVGYDRWRIEDLRRELRAQGIELTLEAHGQGFRDMAPAIDTLERLVAERKLRHGMHSLLTMCLANCVVTRDAAGNRKLDKAKAAGRIDGAVALAMAVAGRFEAPGLPACLAELA